MAIDNILCISNGKSSIILTKFKSAQEYDTRGGWGYTKRITNYKGDKLDIDVNESELGGGGFMCQETLPRERGVGGQSWKETK